MISGMFLPWLLIYLLCHRLFLLFTVFHLLILLILLHPSSFISIFFFLCRHVLFLVPLTLLSDRFFISSSSLSSVFIYSFSLLFSLLLRANIKNFLAWSSWNEVECREDAEGKGGGMGQLIPILWFSVSPSRPLLSWLGGVEGGSVWVVSWDVFAASDFGPKARRSRIPMWVIESQAEMRFISNLLIKVSCRAIYVSFYD